MCRLISTAQKVLPTWRQEGEARQYVRARSSRRQRGSFRVNQKSIPARELATEQTEEQEIFLR